MGLQGCQVGWAVVKERAVGRREHRRRQRAEGARSTNVISRGRSAPIDTRPCSTASWACAAPPVPDEATHYPHHHHHHHLRTWMKMTPT
jgi:hypothetical protein